MSAMDYLSTLVANQVFAGIAGGALLSALLYQARIVPERLWAGLKRMLIVEMEIDNADELFDRVALYFAQGGHARRARRLRMVEFFCEEAQKWEWRPSLGFGWHLLREDGRWFVLIRESNQESSGNQLRRRETMILRFFGRSQEPIRTLIERCEKVHESGATLRVHMWHQGFYMLADRKLKRSLDTLFLPDAQKAAIVADLQRWMGAREAYAARGIPWRRGYLLEGPPGTGKSSLALAMAGLLDRPIYLINLNTAGGDTGLQAAFNNAEPGAVVVIEDIDSARVTHDRESAPAPPDAPDAKPGEAVTLAGLLNAVDGLASRENRILIMTSNHPDALDPALLRPGRVDRREHIGLLAEAEARAMCRSFLGGRGDGFYEAEVAAAMPLSPAALQCRLIEAGE